MTESNGSNYQKQINNEISHEILLLPGIWHHRAWHRYLWYSCAVLSSKIWYITKAGLYFQANDQFTLTQCVMPACKWIIPLSLIRLGLVHMLSVEMGPSKCQEHSYKLDEKHGEQLWGCALISLSLSLLPVPRIRCCWLWWPKLPTI